MTNLSFDHQQIFKASIVRIYDNYGGVVGAGFLGSQKYVLTCAHVIAEALGISDNTPKAPTTPISLDFPLVAPGEILTAGVVFWKPVSSTELVEDIAGLEISEDSQLPSKVQPAPLINSENVRNHSALIFGFPHPEGVYASGILIDKTTKWLQMEDVKVPGYKIESGFSGAPVWDEELRGVVGMVVATEKRRENTKVAFLISVQTLKQAWTQLDSILTTLQPKLQLTPSQRSRLQREWDDLQSPYDLLREKLQHLRKTRAIAVMPDMQFALDENIKDTEQEMNQLKLKIEEVEQQLG